MKPFKLYHKDDDFQATLPEICGITALPAIVGGPWCGMPWMIGGDLCMFHVYREAMTRQNPLPLTPKQREAFLTFWIPEVLFEGYIRYTR